MGKIAASRVLLIAAALSLAALASASDANWAKCKESIVGQCPELPTTLKSLGLQTEDGTNIADLPPEKLADFVVASVEGPMKPIIVAYICNSCNGEDFSLGECPASLEEKFPAGSVTCSSAGEGSKGNSLRANSS